MRVLLSAYGSRAASNGWWDSRRGCGQPARRCGCAPLRRVLVSRGWADLALIDDRDDRFAVGEVNQQALFGRVAPVVHHGGASTTTAARAGAPQVVARRWTSHTGPAGWPAWASALHTRVRLRPPESLSAELMTTLTPQARARATAVACWVRTDGATVAATLLLDEVSREKTPVSA